MTPSPWEFSLLALAAYRLWKLLAEDVILSPARVGPLAEDGRLWPWLSCPWCLGAWISAAWWALWWAFPDVMLPATVPFAVSAAVGIVASVVDALQQDG